MNFAGRDLQRSGPVKRTDRRRQIIVGTKVAQKLAAVRLFHHQDPFYSFKGSRQPFRLHRRQQAWCDQANIESIGGSAPSRFARGTCERAPGDEREIAGPFDACPVVAKVEAIELVAPLVELGQMITGPAGWNATFGMGESVSGVLAA